MPSTIDPTRPLDGMPASKADLRANLAAAKTELEHGGFAEGLSPAYYGPPVSSRTVDHLQAIDDALAAGIGGVTAFADLVDTPSDYIGEANRYLRVKADETGLEFVEQAAGGDASTTSYTAPGTGAVTRSVRDRLSAVISVKDFGASGDGATDDTAAFTAAASAAFDTTHPTAGPTVQTEQALFGHQGRITGATLFIPPGLYRLKNWTLNKAITVIGCGRGSRLAPAIDAVSTDYVVKVVQGPQAYRNRNNHHPGVHFSNFMIDGLRRTINCNGLYLDFVDRSLYQHLIIEEIQGTAIRCFSSVRESTFINLRLMFNGDGTRPQVDLWDASSTAQDSHNNLHFIGCGFMNPIGDNVRIGRDPTNPNTGGVRSIFLSDCLFHQNWTIYPIERATRHLLIQSGLHIHASACRFHGWGEGEGAIFLTAEAGHDPSTGVRAQNVHSVNCNFSRARSVDSNSTPIAPSATSPHVRIAAQGAIWYDCANHFEGLTNAVVDRTLGTHRRWNYVDNPA